MQSQQKYDYLGKRAGVLFPVFSMRRDSDLGIGDTESVRQCLRWLHDYEVGFLQLLPINVSGSDNSPYSAISSVALDFIYLDMLQIPEVSEMDIEKVKLGFTGDWLDANTVDYATVRKVKSKLLRLGYRRFLDEAGESSEFNSFLNDEADWLVPYCKYRWLMEEAGGSEDWMTWPEEYNTAKKALNYESLLTDLKKDEAKEIQNYYAWVQWHAFTQWKEVRKEADELNVKLMGDIPIGVSNASVDVFFEPQWFIRGWYGGAPPETVFKDDAFTCKWGQNWGVPLYDWDALEKDKFSWWKRRVNKLTEIFQIFRIDHILGFYRIYSFPWHPKRNAEFLELTYDEAKELTSGELPHFYPREDDTMVNKAKNLLDGHKYLQAVIDASAGCEVVGEDLGCVPDYVRPHLAEQGIAGFKVCHWELDDLGNVVKAEAHPGCAFATYTTHDHPSISSLWDESRDGVLEGDERASDSLRLLSQFADLPEIKTGEYPEFNSVIKWKLLDALVRSGANYSALMITDVLDDKTRINVPGTVGKHNWTYRVRWSFEKVPDHVSIEMSQLTVLLQKHQRTILNPIKKKPTVI